ncbi:hypothetical protein BK816_00235 [Boudabousia tangfeifanii]|uniref:Phosphatidic acid phosphatase type 2/haloperoxidase domain-containing protein n=1 Tax=Boudabousia tangfeifanii TaxID=1912795 RepID=A0A1D9MIA0_9ACTO|nr:phosphatase PAP2 family protein [Boudabousia tangfeifanii]AOZ71910.1 hypothetical protein BK816_00235 [Boudabousia tangfeifanii]
MPNSNPTTTRVTTRKTRLWYGISAITAAIILGVLTHWDEVVKGDRKVLHELIEVRRDSITTFMETATSFFDPLHATLLAFIVGLVIGWWTRSWREGIYIWYATAAAAALSTLFKWFFQRNRPPTIYRLVTELNFSFPSGHTTATAALACATAFVLVRHVTSSRGRQIVWALAVALILLIALTRLYLGVHWFTDTLAGGLIGSGVAYLLTNTLPKPPRYPRNQRPPRNLA